MYLVGHNLKTFVMLSNDRTGFFLIIVLVTVHIYTRAFIY